MIVTIVVLIILCLYGLKIGEKRAFDGYTSKERTNSIKGIFILIVFLSHIKKYIVDSGYAFSEVGDSLFLQVIGFINQLMVVMFLFYSGYGIMESIKKKGAVYTKAIPRHRILNTLINFDVAVCVFLLVDLLIGNDVSVEQFLLSLLTWDSIGNSNWYIFAILICYFVTWFLTQVVKRKELIWGGHFILLTICAIILYFVRDPWWYNTLWAYPTGILYSTYKMEIEAFLKRFYSPSICFVLCGFLVIYRIPYDVAGFRTNLLSVFFALLVVLFTMRVKIGNPILRWCGEQLFPIYIYQRIPMMILTTIIPTFVVSYPLLYFVSCLIITLTLTYLYRFIKISL